MEDADIHEVDLGDGNSLFAVFDGHGGIIKNMKDTKLANTLNRNSRTL
jgi:serine/threonine protein phosphatase PrpC